MTGFENCPLCGSPKGHAPGCPYGGRIAVQPPANRG